MAAAPESACQIATDVPEGWEFPVIAMNDAVDVLRHGWQDAAGIFAPESPEIAELLQARLEMAVANRALDEAQLLGAIDDVESMAASTGSPSGQALARRLRRTVYEYLLALDAAPPPVLAAHAPAPPAPAPEAEIEEIAALGHRATPAAPEAAEQPSFAEPEVTDEAVAAAAEDATAPEPASPSGAAEPAWQYQVPQPMAETPETEPVEAEAEPEAEAEAAAAAVAEPESSEPESLEPVGAVEDEGEPAAARAAEVEVDQPESADGFVAPRSGFHIVEETHPNHAPPAPASPDDAQAVLETYQWTRPAAPSPPPTAETPEFHSPAADAEPVAATSDLATDVDPENGWRVRPGSNKGVTPTPPMDEDPFEYNPRLADLRRRIDERLRRKRCDEAAALLQELAQETGGRVVAELAMNAGDRCQSLGKSNAALNCYLAASRADPVYELPLSRLADICIDDQDTELAVSYLERIARLYRFRGDDKAALRVYRRVATIAPYREDVLTLLLNVQNTGRFES